MMQALRKELGLTDFPFIMGGLGDYLIHYPLEHHVHINAALQNIAAKDELVGFVSAQGLASNPYNLHFNAASLYEFGLRYFEVFEQLSKGTSGTQSHGVKEDLQRSEMELLYAF